MKKEAKSQKNGLLAVLSISSFRNLWFGQMFSQVAVNMMLFLLALQIYDTTNSNAAVSYLFLSYGIPSVVVGLLAGVIVDRTDKRFVLMLCNAIRAFLVGWLLFISHNILAIYILAFFHAVVTQFYVPAEAPLIPRLVPEDRLISANSLFSFTYYSSMAIGFVLAGPLLKLAGATGSFITIAVMFAIAVVNVIQVKVPFGGVFTEDLVKNNNLFYTFSRAMRDLANALRHVSKQKHLTEAILLLSGTQVVLAILGSLGPGFADQILQIDVRDASVVVLGPVVLGILAGALWVGSHGYKYTQMILISSGIVGAGFVLILSAALLGFSWSSWFVTSFGVYSVILVSLVLFFLFGVFASFLDVPANSILQEQSNPSMRGRVYGILTAAVGGIGMLPVVGGGLLADTIGIGNVLFLLGLGISIYGVFRFYRYNT